MRTPINSSKRDLAGAKASPEGSPAPEPRRRTDPRGEVTRARAGMTIGKLAKLADVSTDTLRFYEDERLLIPAKKSEAGYRLYGEDAVRRLDFIRHAQHCGMTLSEIRQLLEMKADDRSCCSDVRSLAIRKKLQLEQKIKTMQAMSQALSELIEICTDEGKPVDDCPILAALESSMANQQHEPH
ncbi:heavy metal-responsive transcriptional regulator [Rhodanobacter sp. 115]|uniref:heavy metal-responsive transcriptional regulator n=1 Tax=Rhodanobacter sp. FW021-MT20 TaxID=1162282 RepID=UPI00192B86DB|nr:heavy metal-responsive transcriptional regulator [Rhodanobacter sp. 115]